MGEAVVLGMVVAMMAAAAGWLLREHMRERSRGRRVSPETPSEGRRDDGTAGKD